MGAEADSVVYDDMYESGAYSEPYRRSVYYPMMRAALDLVVAGGAHSVLEVGCGSGAFAHMLLDRGGLDYFGFDFSPSGVARARTRTGRGELFAVADARKAEAYARPYDCVVSTEVLEHIEADREVISMWRPGTLCVCSVPNFDYPTHVRVFRHEDDVRKRYGDLIDITAIVRVPRPLMLGRTTGEYFRQLRWSRDNPRKFLGLLGFRTFDAVAGWFVFAGIRRA